MNSSVDLKGKSTPIWQIALPVPLGEVYDYLAPTAVAREPAPGDRVRVPFGRRELIGYFIATRAHSDVAVDALKPVTELIDSQALLLPRSLDLIRFAASYYQHPLGQALATALPQSLRKGLPAAARRQRRKIPEAGDGDEQLPVLTAEQETAVQNVPENGFSTALLEGITGSGKTEIYLRLASRTLEAGKQCLVLVPEISLTPQMIDSFRRRLRGQVVTLHSALTSAERHNAWLMAREGSAGVVLGTRSAVFTPLPRPGLIIVDEEHDSSYKQNDGMRYSARDLAVARARLEDVPAVLGSATPSLESLHNARRGRYRHIALTHRIGHASLPELKILDIRSQRLDQGLAPASREAINTHLEREGQVFLFINRRGFAPTLLCHDCGWTATCQHCDVRLVVHQRQGTLRCHHCGYVSRLPRVCADCSGEGLIRLGQGTERLEDRVREIWPAHPCMRIDSDSVRGRGALDLALNEARSGEARILVGTQILAKGHDFPQLTLVVIVDADQGLNGADFRAPEQLAQLITQVAGRAGRRDAAGHVLIQTHQPDHPLLRSLVRGSYAQWSEQALAERRAVGWPPFRHLALIRAESRQADQASGLLEACANALKNYPALDVMGPVPAMMERRAGRYRFQLMLRADSRGLLAQALTGVRTGPGQSALARKIRWSIDVDPLSLD